MNVRVLSLASALAVLVLIGVLALWLAEDPSSPASIPAGLPSADAPAPQGMATPGAPGPAAVAERIHAPVVPGVLGTASLAGRVVTTDGDPIPGVAVTVTPARVAGPPRPAQVTGVGGRFRFEALPAGHTALSARLDDQLPEFAWIDLGEGERRLGVELVLHPPATLAVALRDALGWPAAGRQVNVQLLGGLFDPRSQAVRRFESTDAEGRLELHPLPAGRYRVSAPPWEEQRLELSAGEFRELTLSSPVSQGLAGVVHGASGPVSVALHRQGDDPWAALLAPLQRVAVHGAGKAHFEIAVEEPGAYRLRAERRDGGSGPFVPVVVRADEVTEVNLALPAGRLTGRLTWDDDGRPAREVRVSLVGDDQRVVQRVSDGAGRFAFENLQAAAWTVRVDGWRHPARGAEDHVHSEVLGRFDLADGEQRDDLSLVLCRGSRLQVRLDPPAGRRPVAEVHYVVVLDAGQGRGPSRVLEAGGAVHFEELEAGAYRLSLRDVARPPDEPPLREVAIGLGDHEAGSWRFVLEEDELRAAEQRALVAARLGR